MSREALRTAAASEVDRWEKQLADELMRLFDRQQAVTLARLGGTKARKHTRHWEPAGERPFETKALFDKQRWLTDAASSATPVVRRMAASTYKRVRDGIAEKASAAAVAAVDKLDDPAIAGRLEDAVKERVKLIAQGVATAMGEVEAFLSKQEADGSSIPDMSKGLRKFYDGRALTWTERIAAVSTVGVINVAALTAAIDMGSPTKQWLSRRDERVRETHEHADGQVVGINERFTLGGFNGHPKVLIPFPGAPMPDVPLNEIINCRCTLLFGIPVPPSTKDAGPLEVKDRVRTPAGARQYGQPIGSTIRRDPVAAGMQLSAQIRRVRAEQLQRGDFVVTGGNLHRVTAAKTVGTETTVGLVDKQGRTEERKVSRKSVWQKVILGIAAAAALLAFIGGTMGGGHESGPAPTGRQDVVAGQVLNAKPPAPTTAAGYQHMFDAVPTAQWGGADVSVSAQLGDGRRAWVYADTLSGNNGFVHSTLITQDGGSLHVSAGGAQLLPNDADTGGRQHIYWPEKVTAVGDHDLEVSAAPMNIGKDSAWDFARTTPQTRVAVVSIDAQGDAHFKGWKGYEAAPADSMIDHGSDGVVALGPHHWAYQGFTHDIDLGGGKVLHTVSQNYDDGFDQHRNPDGTLRFSDWRPIFSAVDAPTEGKAAMEPLETKDKVRTAAGAQHYGQPIGSNIVRDPVTGALSAVFSAPQAAGTAPTAASPSAAGRVVGQIGSASVKDATGDPQVEALVAKYSGKLPATARILALEDAKGRIGAYIAWDGATGDEIGVSVHPKLRGRRIGDQLGVMAAAEDPKYQPSRLSRVTAAAARAGQAAKPPPAPAAAAPARTPRPSSMPTIASHAKPGDVPGTSGDFDADAARIERLQRAYMRDGKDTRSLFGRTGRWSSGREKQQQAIIDHFLNQPGVKKDRQILVLGGLPGAGKTTTINSPTGQQALGIDLSEYVTVNADDVKAQMIATGMVPDYPGLTADESATLYHDESFEIAHSLMRQAARRNLNFAYDTSLKSSSQVGFATSAASRMSPPPWKTTLVLVDVPVSVAKQRAKDRYLAGGRYMPLGLIDGMRGYGAGSRSLPSQNFDAVKRTGDRWVVFDNTGKDPVVAGSGGKRAARSARSANAPSNAPHNAPSAPSKTVSSARSASSPATNIPNIPTPAPANPSKQVAPASSWTPPAGLPPVPAGALVYTHPQGKTVYVMPDQTLAVFKPGGKAATTSATAAKLQAGYGGWTQVVGPDADPAGAAAAAGQILPSTGQNPPSAPSRARTAVSSPTIVAAPKAPLQVSAGAPVPAGSMPIAPMDFNEADLADVPKYIADPNYVFQQKVDGIRGVLVVEPGKAPWFASKKGDRLQSSTAAKITGPMLAKMPPLPAGSPAYRVEGELLNGKFHVFDMILPGQESTPYEQRKVMADAWVDAVAPAMPQAAKLPTARTAAEKQALWDAVLKSGAEGVMMKRKDAGYTAGARVNHTLKAKVTATADVVVLERNRGGKDNAVIGLNVGGKITEIGTVSTGGKDKALGQIQVGDVVEVEYLWATTANTLAQPRIIRKRPDKTVNDATDSGQLRLVDKAVLDVAQKRLLAMIETKVLPFVDELEARYVVRP